MLFSYYKEEMKNKRDFYRYYYSLKEYFSKLTCNIKERKKLCVKAMHTLYLYFTRKKNFFFKDFALNAY